MVVEKKQLSKGPLWETFTLGAHQALRLICARGMVSPHKHSYKANQVCKQLDPLERPPKYNKVWRLLLIMRSNLNGELKTSEIENKRIASEFVPIGRNRDSSGDSTRLFRHCGPPRWLLQPSES